MPPYKKKINEKWGYLHAKNGYYGIVILIALLLSSAPVRALSDRCVDTVTLQRTLNYTFDTGTTDKNLTITKNEDCRYGCDNVTNTCAPSPTALSMWFGIGVFALIIIIGIAIHFYKRI